MRPRKTAIYLLTVLLGLVMVLCGFMAIDIDDSVPFSFLAVSRGGTEKIHFWEKEAGECYVFLPGSVDLEHLHISTRKPIRIGDRNMFLGRSCKGLEWDKAYALSGAGNMKTITFLQSENLPAMYIDTQSGSMDYIHEKKGNGEAGSVRLYDEEGRRNYRGDVELLKGHGNSTFTNSKQKKPYNMKLSLKGDLLSMGEAKKWILLSNLYDSSHLKNKLVFDFAAAAGLTYSPDSRWVDLYLNGNYAGLYLLCEKNEIDPQRIAISEEGSFLISKDKGDRLEQQGIPHFVTEEGVPLRIHSCTMEENAMVSLVQSAENAMFAPDGIDPATGKHWTELIDLDSWVRKYLVEEIFGGGDAGHYSQYFYCEGGKIYAGPVWDYDITMGVDGLVPSVFYAHREHMSPWFHALYGTPQFFNRVMELYEEEFDPLLKTLVEETIPAYAALTSQSARLNALRWFGDAETEARRMQTYMEGRREFLRDIWVKKRPYAEVTVVGADQILTYAPVFAVRHGDDLTDVPAWEACDWYLYGEDTLFDITQPIFEDAAVYAKGTSE